MPGLDYRMARAAIRIREVLELLAFTPTRRRGDELRGPCPLHGSHSPKSRSFAVNLAKDAFRCFVCGAAGNQLDLWAVAQQQPLYPATCDLLRRLGKELPWLTPSASPTIVSRRSPMRPG